MAKSATDNAQKFIIKAKDEFSKLIPRNKIDNVGITSCEEKDGFVEIVGSVATTSPTGKLKTFGYVAKVASDEKGKCSLADLKVKEN